MKWTMLSVALLGLTTYAVIFLAQMQHQVRSPARAGATGAAFELDSPAATASATLAPSAVSEPADAVDTPRWDGDPWTAGLEAFDGRSDELAVAALRAAVAEREDSPYRHYLLALALRRTGEVDDAVIELERSLELGPAAPKTWIALARCELDRGETEAARAAVDAALELDLAQADAWHLLGRIELAGGALEHAAAAFARALQKDPAHLWAANNLGYVRILQGRFDEALAPLQAAVAGGSGEAVFLNNLGTALERCGQPELAALAFAHAALGGHGAAEASLARVETGLAARGQAFAAADSVEFVDLPQLAARVEQAALRVAGTVPDAVAEPVPTSMAAAHEPPDGRE